MSKAIPQTVDEVRSALSKLKAKRGYLLPHHGLLAVAEPDLLDAYDATYTSLTLVDRALTELQKEIVWLTILVSTNEAIATHHIDRLHKCGGTDAHVEAALAMAAWSEGATHFRFVAHNWGPHLPSYDAVSAYRHGLDSLMANYSVEPAIVEISLAATHQCHRRWEWVKEHLRGAYKHEIPERAIAEALSLAMFPGGVPNFVDSCDHWRQMILDGEIQASAPYRAWAELSGQGGFDEAAGIQPPKHDA